MNSHRRRVAALLALLALTAASAPPAGAQTGGTDGHWAKAEIDALAARGVFDGTECDGGGFCPDEPLDRETMAVWVVRLLDGVDPEPVDGSRFADVDASGFHAPFVERMADLSVTQGCGGGLFCPDGSVTRAQMAVFLHRAYRLPLAPDAEFSDVAPSAWYAVSVAALAAAEITQGCGDGSRFCPADDVTRAQMAVFLHNAEKRRGDMPVWFNPVMDGGGVVTTGGRFACGLRPDGTVECWGVSYEGLTHPPAGVFTAVSSGSEASCGLRLDRSLECWGWALEDETDGGWLDAPDGEFAAVEVGRRHMCALRADRTVICWGDNYFGQRDAPDGEFLSVAAGYVASCGLRTDATITCWGDKGIRPRGLTDVPAGEFTAVDSGYGVACGLRTDATITCWGDDPYHGQLNPPGGTFTAISGGYTNHWCALRTNRTIACWGRKRYGPTAAPAGEFLAVSVGNNPHDPVSCGLRTDGTVTCWGDREYVVRKTPAGMFGPA